MVVAGDHPWLSGRKLPTDSSEEPKKLEVGLKSLQGNKHLRIAIARWYSAVRRTDPLDRVLDLCSALEAGFSLSNELRRRLFFAAKAALPRRAKGDALIVYKMYGARNRFIHGSGIPDITSEDSKQFLEVVPAIIKRMSLCGRKPSDEEIEKEIFGDSM